MPPPSEHAVRSAAIRLPEVETGPSIGRRWTGVLAVCLGAFVFAASSGPAVASHGTGLLIAAEALMGVGGAAVPPTSLSIVGHTFTDPHERTTTVAMASITALLCRHRNVRVTESTERPDGAVMGAWEGVR